MLRPNPEGDHSVQIVLSSRPRGNISKEIPVLTFSSDPGVLSTSKLKSKLESRQKIDRGPVQIHDPRTPTLTQIAVVVDGGPQLVSWVHDGLFEDGGESRVFGYGFFEQVGDVNGGGDCRVGEDVVGVRVYDRVMRTAELIQNFRAGFEYGDMDD